MAKKPTNHYLVVQDRSGSMTDRVSDTIGGFNSYVEDLKTAKGKTRVHLVQFDHEYTPVFWDKTPGKVPLLDGQSYQCRGSTALFDAVGRAVGDLQDYIDPQNDVVTVVIMTDGHENSSREFDKDKITQLIKDYEAKGNYTFVYMGAGTAAWDNATKLGIALGNTLNYGGSGVAHRDAFVALSSASLLKNESTLRGETATKSFYDANGRRVDTSDSDSSVKVSS